MCPPTPTRPSGAGRADARSFGLALRVFLIACALLLAWAQMRPRLDGQSAALRWPVVAAVAGESASPPTS